MSLKPIIKRKANSLLPLAMMQFAHLRHISGWKDLIGHIMADRIANKIKLNSCAHLFLIAGLPKSGTTWLEQLLACTPGLVKLNGSTLRNYPRKIKLNHPHDIDSSMVKCAPQDKLSFLKLHLNPYHDNLKILDENNIRTIVLIRDLRDVLISHYFHNLNDSESFNHYHVKNLPRDEAFLASIKSYHPNNSVPIIDYYSQWIRGWLKRSRENPENTLLIRYEEMHKDIENVLSKIFEFYGYDITIDEIKKIIIKQELRHKDDKKKSLKENFNKKGNLKSTFRSGKINQWKDFYTKNEISFIKQNIKEILIESGYEENDSW